MNKKAKKVTKNEQNKTEKTPYKHWYLRNFFFKGVWCGFVVNGKKHETTQTYAASVIFIISK